MSALSPELVAEAQSIVAGWASQVGSPRAEAELWGTEWPVWELLGKLQQRLDVLRSPASTRPPSSSSPPSAPQVDARAPPWAEALQRAVGFSDTAWRLATEGLLAAHASAVPPYLRESVQCADGQQCLGELFGRMHLLLHSSGALPLRDAIAMDSSDSLSSVFLERSRALMDTDGVDYDWGSMVLEDALGDERAPSEKLDKLMPANHPLQVDRRQLANFILQHRDLIASGPLERCLEWDQPLLLVRAFRHVCRWFDIFSYSEPDPKNPMMGMPGRHEYPHGTRHYWGDLEHPEGPGIEPDTFDLILVPFVFEHVSQPFIAMRNLAALLRPGGYMIWAAPFIQQYHGSPHDYFRYTPKGARSLATHSGLEVVKLYAPGDLALTSGMLNGMLLPYWSEAHALAEEPPKPGEDSPRHPMNVFTLLRRPPAVDK